MIPLASAAAKPVTVVAADKMAAVAYPVAMVVLPVPPMVVLVVHTVTGDDPVAAMAEIPQGPPRTVPLSRTNGHAANCPLPH